jgi:hypothetical protein
MQIFSLDVAKVYCSGTHLQQPPAAAARPAFMRVVVEGARAAVVGNHEGIGRDEAARDTEQRGPHVKQAQA